MFEVDEAARIITESVDSDANIIFGATINEEYNGELKITVCATGFDEASNTEYTDKASFNVFTGGRAISYKSSSVSGAFIMGTSYDFQEIQKLEYESGRYFNALESNSGSNKVILGYKVAQQLFNNFEPVGKQVKVFGQKFTVVGVLKEEGESMFNFINFDIFQACSYGTI